MKLASPSQREGAAHETAAAQLLKKRGLRIVARNFHCKLGELDIVALDKAALLHFVEVRYRKGDKFGSAAESVTRSKQIKIQRTAEFFLQRHPRFRNNRAQFDVVTVSGTHCRLQMVWIESAF